MVLVSDHFFGDGRLQSQELYMTVAEQLTAVLAAGLSSWLPGGGRNDYRQ